jgi:DNA (cytosine-5)-methyltransferase 1
MKYLSLFSGIEAATVGWHHLGWECVGVSEIDPFACEVLKQRLPHIPNLGDITKITKEKLNEIRSNGLDIVVGGSPCQAFSVAGLRKGLEDPRGNLMLEYIRVVATVLPTYFIWENVPGVLSSNGGRDFGTLLQAMEKLGYQLCWRTLDSKNFGVPQRRRRVFLVGSLANNRHPFEILFEPKSLQGNHTKSKEKRKNNTSKTPESTEEHLYRLASLRTGGNVESNVSPTLTSTMGSGDTLPVTTYTAEKQYAATLCARDYKGICSDSFGHDSQQLVNTKTKVRRLTPIECERLQGFPDNWTQIAWRGKEPKDCPISHRYKCLGNSMTTNVMRWIGERIAGVPTTIPQKKIPYPKKNLLYPRQNSILSPNL